MKNKGFGHLQSRLFTIKTSKRVGFGGLNVPTFAIFYQPNVGIPYMDIVSFSSLDGREGPIRFPKSVRVPFFFAIRKVRKLWEVYMVVS